MDGAFRVAAVFADRTLDFTYDPAGRLTGADGPWGTGSFAYDLSGNRRTKQLGAESTTYAVSPTSNHLLCATGAEAASYGYDAAGRLAAAGTHTYAYNPLGRLETVSEGGGALGTYAYDGKGGPREGVSNSRGDAGTRVPVAHRSRSTRSGWSAIQRRIARSTRSMWATLVEDISKS